MAAKSTKVGATARRSYASAPKKSGKNAPAARARAASDAPGLSATEKVLSKTAEAAGYFWGSLVRLLGPRGPTRVAATHSPTTAAPPKRAPAGRPKRTNLENFHPVVRALLEHVELPNFEQKGVSTRAVVHATSSPSGKVSFDEATRSNAMIFGATFDRMIDAEKAWKAPLRLADRLGHLEVRRIARMSPDDLAVQIRGPKKGDALHRLVGAMARNLINVSEILVRDYGGDAENLWPDGTPVPVLQERLKSLPGLGDKLVNMLIVILVRDYGKHFPEAHRTDIAVDRHVARVFLRTGLVRSGPQSHRSPSVGSLKLEVIQRARELYPPYPAGLDLPTFLIGKEFCRALGSGGPQCGRCPLRGACARGRLGWDVS